MSTPEPVAQTPQGLPLVGTAEPSTSSPATPARRCQATTRDGKPCGMTPRADSGLCFSHDPACHDQVIAAGRKGASESHRRRVIAASAQTLTLDSVDDAATLIASTLDKLIKGEMDRATANGIVYGCQVFLRTIDVRDLQRRIEALEGTQK